MSEVDLKVYERVLNDYHINLVNAAFLSSHLLDRCLDDSSLPEWQRSACHMMRDRLIELAEGLPFPSMSQASASPAPTAGRADVAPADPLG